MGSLVVVQLCYVGIGASEKGKEFLQAIEAFKDQKCVLNEVSEKSFLAQQDSVAQILRGKGEAESHILYRTCHLRVAEAEVCIMAWALEIIH